MTLVQLNGIRRLSLGFGFVDIFEISSKTLMPFFRAGLFCPLLAASLVFEFRLEIRFALLGELERRDTSDER